jgi:hypothetical protein
VDTIVKTCANRSDMDTRSALLQLMNTSAKRDVTVWDEVALRMSDVLKNRKTELLPLEMRVIVDASHTNNKQSCTMRTHLTQAGLNVFVPDGVM